MNLYYGEFQASKSDSGAKPGAQLSTTQNLVGFYGTSQHLLNWIACVDHPIYMTRPRYWHDLDIDET